MTPENMRILEQVSACCGRPLLTPFCPMCGKPNADPALELVAFLRQKVATYKTQAAVRKKRTSADERSIQTCEDKANKMEVWANRVVELAHLEPKGDKHV